VKWANAVPLRPPGQVARLDALGQRGGVAWRRDTGGRKRDFIRVGGAVTAGALIDPPAISGSFNVSPVGCFAGWAIVMVHEYDMIVFGGGVAGLWVANTLKRAGYNVIVIEKDKLGAGQTLASQGMIHGGQKYLLQGVMTSHAAVASKMPARWQANFDGRGEIDLTSVRVLSETQIMWPAGSILSAVTVLGAAKLLKTRSRMLTKDVFPDALKNKKEFKGPVYMLPEKVVDMRSLIIALAKNLAGRVLKGEINDMRPDGAVAVSGQALRAQRVIFAAGTGNELALSMLRVTERLTQRRPLRQVMVRPLPYAFFAHGIAGNASPRITVTSHPTGDGGYVWYLGGGVAEKGANMDEAPALRFAKKELNEIFPEIDWNSKEWATWHGDRAEPLDARGALPSGPFVYTRGRVLMAWPTKLTFTPALSDRIFECLEGVSPAATSAPPPLPTADIASYPWEVAAWQRIA
jgi:glycine/D-amino acid oxidase-like deaminating enzyme